MFSRFIASIRSPWCPLLWLFVVLGGVGCSSDDLPAQELADEINPAVASPAQAAKAPRPVVAPTGTRSRSIGLDRRAIGVDGGVGGKPADKFRLDLFADASFVAQVRRRYVTDDGTAVVEANLAGVEQGQALFVSKYGWVSGTVTTPHGIYQIRSDGKDGHVVTELDPSLMGQEEPIVPTPKLVVAPSDSRPGALTDDGSVIDVLVLYTATARTAAGGSAAMESQINLAVAETNVAYSNSGITQRLRLVKTAEVSYAETGTIQSDLDRLTNTADGYMDDVHGLRDTYGADLVSLMVENGGAYCGVGWGMTTPSVAFAPYGFSVVARGCSTGYYSFGHELGHNMGAMHDVAVDSGTTPYPYAHGYVNLAGHWRTVMAYNNECQNMGFSCTRIQYFSNPSLTYAGAPLGNASADNRQTLNNTASIVANFRTRVRQLHDFNGDGKSDILWRNDATGEDHMMLMNGATITVGSAFYREPNLAWKIVATADFSGDGKSDILWRNDATGEDHMMLMNGTAITVGSAFYREPNLAWKIVATGDYDGDGKADILWRNDATGEVYMMFMNGTAVRSGSLFYREPNLAWKIVASGDFNGDGKSDILWRNDATGEDHMMLMNGATITVGSAFYREPNLAWKIVATADFNGDGKSDILWRNDATGEDHMMLMNGTAITVGSAFYREPNLAWKIVATGDYDGDGKADILWRNDATGEVYMMFMNGTSVRSGSLFYREPNLAWRILP